MNREVLDDWCERGILFLTLAILVFAPLAMGAVHVWDFLVVQGMAIVVLLLWLARLWLKPKPKLLWPPVCWAVIAFSIYAVIRWLTADIEYVARLETVQVLIYAFLFLAIINNLHRQEAMQLVVLTLVFLAMAIAFYAVYQFVSGSYKIWNITRTAYGHRASGTFYSPNNLAGFLEMVLPLGLAWVLVSRARSLTKVFVGYASLVILAGIAVTVSRGGWISTAVALMVLVVVLLFHRIHRLPALMLLVAVVGIGIYFGRDFFIQSRLKNIVKEGQINDDLRFTLWRPAVDMWRTNPWWGVGPAHFDCHFGQYRPEEVQVRPDRVHNDYLNTLTDWGIVGAAIVAAALGFLFAGVLKTWPFVRGSPAHLGERYSTRFALVLGAGIGLLAILLHSVVDFNMHIPANALVAVTLMALLTACLRFATERYWFWVRLWMRIALGLALTAGIVFFACQGARRAREDYWLTRAEKSEVLSTNQLLALEKAHTVEPKNPETTHALAEFFRIRSWQGDENDYVGLAREAMKWYALGWKLNPYDARNWMGYGQCLDWIGDHGKAETYYDRAMELEPNSYYVTAVYGWHYVQSGDYAAARNCFERSLRLEWRPEINPMANSYMKIVTAKLLQEASAGKTLK